MRKLKKALVYAGSIIILLAIFFIPCFLISLLSVRDAGDAAIDALAATGITAMFVAAYFACIYVGNKYKNVNRGTVLVALIIVVVFAIYLVVSIALAWRGYLSILGIIAIVAMCIAAYIAWKWVDNRFCYERLLRRALKGAIVAIVILVYGFIADSVGWTGDADGIMRLDL